MPKPCAKPHPGVPKLLPRRHPATGDVLPGEGENPGPLKLPSMPKGTRAQPAYLALLRKQHCWVCGYHKSQAHHYPHKGMGGGGNWHDLRTVALCRGCHAAAHDSPAFEIGVMTPAVYDRMITTMLRYWGGER